MDDGERREYLAILRATPRRLKAATKGLPKAVVSWTPAPGKWSILEIVCHLADMERDAYLARYRRILAEEAPLLPDADADVYALENDYRARKLVEAVREWSALRRECLRLLSKVKRDQWDRAGLHETAGRVTLADLLKRQALGNDEAHLGQIEAVKVRRGVLARLSATPKRLSTALRGFSPEALRRAPAEGKWSAIEIACHLRDVDRLNAERVTKAAFSEGPLFWTMDNDRVPTKLRYRDAEPGDVLKEHRRRREDLVSLLRALPHPVWQRTGTHPRHGELTIERLTTVIADHDDRHLGRIEALPKT